MYKEYGLTLLDEELSVKKRFSVKEFEVTDIMGRNDLCFCGSEKKVKYCHPEVYKKSIMAQLLTAYRQIYKKIEENQKYTVCCKGCNNCCSDYFKVSVTEFFSILYCLGIGSEIALKYSSEAKKKIKDVYLPEDDSVNVPDFPECIFVDEISGECRIYAVRPSMCRIYGSISEITKCKKVLSSEKAKNHLLSLDKELAATISENIDFVKGETEKYGLASKPMIYWFSRLDENGEFKTRRLSDLFTASFERPIDDFVKILLL